MHMHAGATATVDDEGMSSDEDPAPSRLSQPYLISYLLKWLRHTFCLDAQPPA